MPSEVKEPEEFECFIPEPFELPKDGSPKVPVLDEELLLKVELLDVEKGEEKEEEGEKGKEGENGEDNEDDGGSRFVDAEGSEGEEVAVV